jgi:enoyl-CoA hydratase/carnithine racemase
MMATGRLVDFEEAARLGIVTETWEAAGFMDRARAYARSFCAPERASQSVGLMKRAVQTGAEVALADGLALERELQQRLFAAEDAAEGISAYVEKRKPAFKGR